MVAIFAGAGDRAVRAGVLRILATLPGVTVTQGASAGQPTLVLTGGADEVGPGHQEQLTVNTQTGAPISFVGGALGSSTGPQVAYKAPVAALAGGGQRTAARGIRVCSSAPRRRIDASVKSSAGRRTVGLPVASRMWRSRRRSATNACRRP